MTRQKSFKRLVRARMDKTGESYTAARAVLLAAATSPNGEAVPWLATSDESIRARTGRGWEDWFGVLDAWGALERPHRDIAKWLAAELGLDPLAWNVQAITASYERARGLRVAGQRADGTFTATTQRTIAVPVKQLFDGFLASVSAEMGVRTSTRPKSARFDWAGGPSRVHATFASKPDGRSSIAVEHARLTDAASAVEMKDLWRSRLDQLKTELERGPHA